MVNSPLIRPYYLLGGVNVALGGGAPLGFTLEICFLINFTAPFSLLAFWKSDTTSRHSEVSRVLSLEKCAED